MEYHTYMFLLLVQRILCLHGSFPLLALIDVKSTRSAFEIPKCFVAEDDSLVDSVIQKHLVVGRQDQCAILGDEVLLQPECSFKVLYSGNQEKPPFEY